jgi:radical SAM superfamily enzyme YgiQ (UPF0313 family)
MNPKDLRFEQGPIRPPNEAQSLLLRFTRNCPWNQCEFCPVYKGQKFSLRSVEEIKQDIQTARDIADEIQAVSWKLGYSGNITDAVINPIFSAGSYSSSYRSVAAWMYYGTGACFLQDADTLIMRTDDLVEALTFLRHKFPEITRVTTYSRSRTVAKKSLESLKRIRESGLDRVHIGLETGCDPLLQLVKKGVTAAQQVEAGRKLMAAGMEVSEYVMPGLGGREMWRQHAVETARVLNQINPHFIRLRSLRVPQRVPLHVRLKDGSFHMLTDDELAEEIRVFIVHLDKPRMLAVIQAYQELPDSERLIYRVGRRGGAFRSTRDLQSDPATYRKIQQMIAEVQQREGLEAVERLITDMVDQYI